MNSSCFNHFRGFFRSFQLIFITGLLKTVIRSLLFLCISLSFFSPVHGESLGHQRVLFISSYSYNWPTIPLQIAGIQSALDPSVTLHYEFMDTKRLSYEQNKLLYYKAIKTELTHSLPYDAIILGDDAALQFALDYHDELFRNVPLVFEGVNDIDRARTATQYHNITGIIQAENYKENIDTATHLFPNAKRLVAIVDNSLTGIGQQKTLFQFLRKNPNLAFDTINLSELTYDEFIERIKALDSSTIPFLFTAGTDRNDRTYSSKDIVSIIKKYSPVPVLTMVHPFPTISFGLLGGYVVDHEASGKLAGSIVQRILHGEKPNAIPVVPTSPYAHYYNWQVMKTYAINKDFLPADSIFVNQDETLLDKYSQAVIWGLTGILVVAFIVVIVILRSRNRLLQQVRLRNTQLIEVSERAEQANKAKTLFLSRMSHEIRTPMNAIMGLTELAQNETNLSETMNDKLRKIMASSHQLLNLINDVLDTSSIERQKFRINPQPFHFRNLIDSIYTTHRPLFQKKKIDFNLSIQNVTDPVLVCDTMRLIQILNNLLSNALKFTEPGGAVTLGVTQKKQTNTQIFLDFLVKDTGCGISEEMKQRIFKPFEQEDSTTATRYGGSGLGLSICKSLAELMHGTISVDSQKGNGCTFIVSLPLERIKNNNIAVENTISEKYEKTGTYDFSGNKIMLVEDNALNREIAEEFLRMAGLEVDSLENGRSALEHFEKSAPGTYALVLMDILMPLMNGYEATKAIRQSRHPDARTIPVIAMSANTHTKDIADSIASGMNDHINKPIDSDILYKTLSHYLHKKTSA